MNNNLALYIHWPFCKSKCPYCDFNSHVQSKIDYEAWLNAYIKEINYFAEYLSSKTITSIFFGGGTPSLMPVFIVDKILAHLSQFYNLADNIEITLEANPTSFEAEKFQQFRAAGINRISLGIQSLNDNDLKFLGREHSAQEAIKTIEHTAQIFDNFSFDLIYARPKQIASAWEEELEHALSFGTKHLSLYQLTIEKGTRFYSDYNKGLFTMPDEQQKLELYNLTEELLNKHNMPAYEVSNYAKPKFESQHNLAYWRYSEYLGLGPGAHSRIVINDQLNALMMHNKPDNWLQNIQNKANSIQQQTQLSADDIFIEGLMMKLRIFEPIYFSWFKKIGINNIDCIRSKLEQLANNDMFKIFDDHFIITNSGRLVLNSIIEYLSD